jgi:transposase
MKTCPRYGSKKWWYLSTGQIRGSSCGLTRKKSKNLWGKTRISPHWKGRLVDYFCLGVPAYRLRFPVPYSQPTILRWFRNLREVIYQDIIKDLEPLSGEIKMNETMFGGKKLCSLILHVTLKPEASTILITGLPIPFYLSVVTMG